MAFFALVMKKATGPAHVRGAFVVEELLDVRERGSERQFLVRWAGYSQGMDTWEPEGSLPAELVAAWPVAAADGRGGLAATGPRSLQGQEVTIGNLLLGCLLLECITSPPDRVSMWQAGSYHW
jgi:hypothetical protein